MTCPYCRETIQDEAVKCRYCGSFIGQGPSAAFPASSGEITDDEIRVFVGEKPLYYLDSFRKFRIGNTDRFAVTWNWPACLFTFFWMLYRKMYLQAGITFLIFMVPGFNLLLAVAVGMTGNYMYFRHVREKIAELKSLPPSGDPAFILREVGGVNRWVIPVGIVGGILILMLMFAMVAAFLAAFSSFEIIPGRLDV